jgi:protein archease
MSEHRNDAIFRELEHTADLGIEVVADSRAELFRRAAIAIACLMVDTSRVRRVESREVDVAGIDDADLMHEMLSGLLPIFLVESFIWSDAEIDERGDHLKVRVVGERFDPARHEFHQEIKAVTYHELAVRNADGRWSARIIFDV